MSRSYRYSPESGHSNTGGERHNDRRSNRRERRLVSELAAQADAFVLPPRAEPSTNAGFRSENRFSTPATSAARR
ncbi:MAG: hypothetical protein IT342_21780 [Candidatus Melainabacteria bacterium]|nr:hypothetical protein [Candidatus Melainabacteria bacterium]